MNAAPTWTRLLLASSIVVSIICVVATLFGTELEANRAIPSFIRSLELTAENTAGAWWSGVLLLVAAVHMTDGFIGNASRGRLATGWLAVASVLVLLSADEVGSIHERVGGWGEILPFALLLGAALGFGVLALWSSAQRAAALWIAVAFLLFASVAGHEYLENSTTWLSDHGDLRAMLEEGTEIVGMLILLRVGLANLRLPAATLGLLHAWKGTMLFVVLVAAAPLAYFTLAFDDGRGYPSARLGSACFLRGGLAVARAAQQCGSTNLGLAHGTLAASCVLASLNAVVHNPSDLPNRGYFVLAALLVAMGALFPATVPSGRRVHYVGVIAVSLVLVAACWEGVPLVVAYIVLPVIAALVLYSHAEIGHVASVAVEARSTTAALLHPPAQ